MIQPCKPLYEEEFLPGMLLFESSGFHISAPKDPLDFTTIGTHSHRGYEFMIPVMDMAYINVGGKNLYGYKNHVIPINPEQEHGINKIMTKTRFLNILIDQSCINNLFDNVYTNKSPEFINGVYPLSSKLRVLVSMFMHEGRIAGSGQDVALQSLGMYIGVLLLREIKCNLYGFNWKHTSGDYNKIRPVLEYLRQNERSEYSLNDLAAIAGMSRYHFIRVFRNNTGTTPYEHLLNLKLQKAMALLSEKRLTVTEICMECGFNNVSHFIRLFKKKTGVTPTYYRSMLD